ncbi:methylenetetrahydrofolate reductase [Acrasis kona]|uniref:Methylenetetrahydrofolate reductase n=1 Tax=Acrasis kona TaxID=1008807 RepID=A0AAW2Z087_9EUKA
MRLSFRLHRNKKVLFAPSNSYSKVPLVVAEITCKREELPSTIAKRAEVFLNSASKAGLKGWVAFSDTPFSDKKYFSMDDYLRMNLFKELPKENILPVLAIGDRTIQEISQLVHQIQCLDIHKLLLVSGDGQTQQKRLDHISTTHALQNIPNLAKEFKLYTAAHFSKSKFQRLQEKINLGADGVILQPTYSEDNFKEFISNFKTLKDGRPLLACVTPVTNRNILKSLSRIDELSLGQDELERLHSLSENELRDEGLKLCLNNITMYYQNYDKLDGIYIYTRSHTLYDRVVDHIKNLNH